MSVTAEHCWLKITTFLGCSTAATVSNSNPLGRAVPSHDCLQLRDPFRLHAQLLIHVFEMPHHQVQHVVFVERPLETLKPFQASLPGQALNPLLPCLPSQAPPAFLARLSADSGAADYPGRSTRASRSTRTGRACLTRLSHLSAPVLG